MRKVPAKGNPRRRRPDRRQGRGIPRDSAIWCARESQSGGLCGFLIARDGKPCGFVRTGALHNFDVAVRIAREPTLLDEGSVAGLTVDDLRQCMLFGRYISLPWHVLRPVYIPMSARGSEVALPDGFDYAQFSVVTERGEIRCAFLHHRDLDEAYRPAWLTERQQRSGSHGKPLTLKPVSKKGETTKRLAAAA